MGYDAFPRAQLEVGCDRLLDALADAGHEVTHLPSHLVVTDFPETVEKLDAYDVVILSDIGANSLLLPPVVFSQGQRFPNRLKVLAEWVRRGGGLMMAGGYLQKLTAKADAEVLATVEGRPLLAARAEGAGRTLAYASDISPHWAPEEFMAWAGYQRLFGQGVTWLAGGSRVEDGDTVSAAAGA